MTTHRPFDAPRGVVVDAVARALAEDLTPLGDISAALLPPEARAVAQLVARTHGVIAGAACVDEAFAQVSTDI